MRLTFNRMQASALFAVVRFKLAFVISLSDLKWTRIGDSVNEGVFSSPQAVVRSYWCIENFSMNHR